MGIENFTDEFDDVLDDETIEDVDVFGEVDPGGDDDDEPDIENFDDRDYF